MIKKVTYILSISVFAFCLGLGLLLLGLKDISFPPPPDTGSPELEAPTTDPNLERGMFIETDFFSLMALDEGGNSTATIVGVKPGETIPLNLYLNQYIFYHLKTKCWLQVV